MSLLEQVGRAAIVKVEDTGALTMQFWSVLRKLPRVLPIVGTRRRWRSAIQQLFAIGASALPMGRMALCTGFIPARKHLKCGIRALEFVETVVIGYTRELGRHHRPQYRAAGRVGYLAEIGTMVDEEIDAIRMMGLIRWSSRWRQNLGALIAMPCLTVLSTLCGTSQGTCSRHERNESSRLLSGGRSSDSPAGRRVRVGQEPGVRHGYRPRRLPGRPASPRRSGSRWAFHHGRRGEINLPHHPCGPGDHGNLLSHGLEFDRMTTFSTAKTGDP